MARSNVQPAEGYVVAKGDGTIYGWTFRKEAERAVDAFDVALGEGAFAKAKAERGYSTQPVTIIGLNREADTTVAEHTPLFPKGTRVQLTPGAPRPKSAKVRTGEVVQADDRTGTVLVRFDYSTSPLRLSSALFVRQVVEA